MSSSAAEGALFVVNLVSPFLALACLPIGIVLAQQEMLNRRLGAVLVAILVPVLWPGLSMVALAVLLAPQNGGATYWISLLVPDLVLLVLVGSVALGVYWLATRGRPST